MDKRMQSLYSAVISLGLCFHGLLWESYARYEEQMRTLSRFPGKQISFLLSQPRGRFSTTILANEAGATGKVRTGTEPATQVSQDAIVNLCKRRGFIYQSFEPYNGLSNCYDYGPLGSLLKRNVQDLWWKSFLARRTECVAVDTSILTHPQVLVASKHVENFSDPVAECRSCHKRHRADHLVEKWAKSNSHSHSKLPDNTNEALSKFIKENQIKCPHCQSIDLTDVNSFQLMFQTHMGPVENSANLVYLRPETAQGIFMNFEHAIRVSRKTLPFGIGQIGKAFRNEITPSNFIFRMREFEQMELEYFVKPSDAKFWIKYWKNFCYSWLLDLGMNQKNLRIHEHSRSDLAHYSDEAYDIEYKFPFGWGELWGIAHRGDFDMKSHGEHSGRDLKYTDLVTKEKYYPHVVEPSVGVDRLIFSLLCDAYHIENPGTEEERTVLKLHPSISPYRFAVFPLLKKAPMTDIAQNLAVQLSKYSSTDYDTQGAIGRRYRRHDEIGTPYCITVDHQTIQDQTITVRERDSMKQIRIHVNEILSLYGPDSCRPNITI